MCTLITNFYTADAHTLQLHAVDTSYGIMAFNTLFRIRSAGDSCAPSATTRQVPCLAPG